MLAVTSLSRKGFFQFTPPEPLPKTDGPEPNAGKFRGLIKAITDDLRRPGYQAFPARAAFYNLLLGRYLEP
jgi:hypothetical protein